MRRLIAAGSRQGNILAIVLATLVVAYLAWKVAESPSQSVQFAFNGLSVGAVYALLAMGFTLVYSTVWFFDLYYGAAAAVGAYGVFYLRSKEAIGGLYEVQNPVVNALFAAVVAGVVAWSLYEFLAPRIRDRVSPRVLYSIVGATAAVAGVYSGLVFTYTDNIHLLFGPVAGLGIGVAVGLGLREALLRLTNGDGGDADHLCANRCGAGGRGCRGGDHRRHPGVEAVPELGGILPAGRVCRVGAVQGPLRDPAKAGALAADHARRIHGRPAGHQRRHHHRL